MIDIVVIQRDMALARDEQVGALRRLGLGPQPGNRFFTSIKRPQSATRLRTLELIEITLQYRVGK